jgi:hypothetical protein
VLWNLAMFLLFESVFNFLKVDLLVVVDDLKFFTALLLELLVSEHLVILFLEEQLDGSSVVFHVVQHCSLVV